MTPDRRDILKGSLAAALPLPAFLAAPVAGITYAIAASGRADYPWMILAREGEAVAVANFTSLSGIALPGVLETYLGFLRGALPSGLKAARDRFNALMAQSDALRAA